MALSGGGLVTGAVTGATYGSSFGPVGTVIGGIGGALVGGLFGGGDTKEDETPDMPMSMQEILASARNRIDAAYAQTGRMEAPALMEGGWIEEISPLTAEQQARYQKIRQQLIKWHDSGYKTMSREQSNALKREKAALETPARTSYRRATIDEYLNYLDKTDPLRSKMYRNAVAEQAQIDDIISGKSGDPEFINTQKSQIFSNLRTKFNIEGNNLDDAVAHDTPGIQALSEARRQLGLLREDYINRATGRGITERNTGLTERETNMLMPLKIPQFKTNMATTSLGLLPSYQQQYAADISNARYNTETYNQQQAQQASDFGQLTGLVTSQYGGAGSGLIGKSSTGSYSTVPRQTVSNFMLTRQ